MKNFILTLMTTLILPMTFAHAEIDPGLVDIRPIVIKQEFTVKDGDTKIIRLPRYAFLDRVSMEVNTGLFCGKNHFSVSFEGYAHQNVDIKGGLTGYRNKIISANVWARTLEIHNTSGCKIKVRKIEVLPRRWYQGRTQGRGNGQTHGQTRPVVVPVSEAGAQVSFLLENILYIDNLVDDSDRVQFITPSKRVFGKALAVLNSAPETSQASLQAIKAVLEQLYAIRPLLDRLSSIEATFEVAQEIHSVETCLERMVR